MQKKMGVRGRPRTIDTPTKGIRPKHDPKKPPAGGSGVPKAPSPKKK